MKNLYPLIIFIFLIGCQNKRDEELSLKAKSEEIKKALADSLKRMDSLRQIEVAYLKDSVKNLKIKYKITKISGGDNGNTRAEYLSLHEMVKETKKISELEMWEPKKYKSEIESDKALHRGGEIVFTMIRSSESAADGANFDIIIHDQNEEEIERSTHPKSGTTTVSYHKNDQTIKKPYHKYYKPGTNSSKGPITKLSEARKARMYRSTALESPGKIVYTEATPSKPSRLSNNRWLKCKILRLQEKVEFPFYIYFIDKYNETRVKYKVEAIDKN